MERRFRHIFVWLFALLIFPMELLACQCTKTSNKFITRLHKASFIGYVEILGFDTIKDHDFDRTFTIVKLIEQFQGEPIGETIAILDGSENIECQRSFSYFQIGQRFIIKAHFQNRKDHEFNLEDTPLPNIKTYGQQVLALSSCSENVIEIAGELASGKITKSKKQILNLDLVVKKFRNRTRLS